MEAVRNITNTRIAEMLVVYRNNVRIQTSNETLRLDFIVALNASGVLKNDAMV